MKIALTGATGFVGSHIVTELQAQGHEVTALVRDDSQAASVAAKGPPRPSSTCTTWQLSSRCSARPTAQSTRRAR